MINWQRSSCDRDDADRRRPLLAALRPRDHHLLSSPSVLLLINSLTHKNTQTGVAAASQAYASL